MMQTYLFRLLNLFLRCGTLASKFILIFFIAKHLPTNEVGLYGLIVATIAYSIYPLGLEYHLYNSRLIIASDKSRWGGLLKDQATLHLIIYFLILPLFLFIFIAGILPWQIAPQFFFLLIFEHINQEMMRLFNAISKQVSASISLFIRQGLWVIPTVLLIQAHTALASINFILSMWLAFNILSFIFSASTIYSLNISLLKSVTNWTNIRKGIRTSRILLLSAISLNIIFVIDKYLFKFLQDNEALGAYTFFFMLASAFISFADASVFSFMYPKIVIAVNKKNRELIKSSIRSATHQLMLICFLFVLTAHLSIYKILEYLGRKEYTDHVTLFYYFIFSITIYAFSFIPDYFLYANNEDSKIAKIHMIGFMLFLLTATILSSASTYLSIPLSMCITFLWILLSKSIAAFRLFRHTRKEGSNYNAY